MFTTGQWILILALLVIAIILSPSENNKTDYHNYDCYDKSIYKCGKCMKKCKWHCIVKRAEKLEKDMREFKE